jgi:uncharacterized protein
VVDVVPLVDYLVLEPTPHLIANQCASCGARFFDRRNACARCSGLEFTTVNVATCGTVKSFTIVAFAAPGVDVPFVAAQIDCAGTTVAGNLIDLPPDPEHVKLGMQVELVTYSMGTDSAGVEGISFGFAPVDRGTGNRQ